MGNKTVREIAKNFIKSKYFTGNEYILDEIRDFIDEEINIEIIAEEVERVLEEREM